MVTRSFVGYSVHVSIGIADLIPPSLFVLTPDSVLVRQCGQAQGALLELETRQCRHCLPSCLPACLPPSRSTKHFYAHVSLNSFLGNPVDNAC